MRGRIINIASIHGLIGVPEHFTYAVNKGALIQMTRQVALEHGRDGILCQRGAPRQDPDRVAGRRGPDGAVGRHVRGRTPFGRLGTPRDIAAVVSFLVSDGASFMSGSNLVVDGGVIAS